MEGAAGSRAAALQLASLYAARAGALPQACRPPAPPPRAGRRLRIRAAMLL
jgi:hypothetical protein